MISLTNHPQDVGGDIAGAFNIFCVLLHLSRADLAVCRRFWVCARLSKPWKSLTRSTNERAGRCLDILLPMAVFWGVLSRATLEDAVALVASVGVFMLFC
jgi:hypothetical protein